MGKWVNDSSYVLHPDPGTRLTISPGGRAVFPVDRHGLFSWRNYGMQILLHYVGMEVTGRSGIAMNAFWEVP
jgi:hypothetical protein